MDGDARPCISIPAGHGPAGLPMGVQLVGLPGQDRALLGWAGWLEESWAAKAKGGASLPRPCRFSAPGPAPVLACC
ncbi:hypothetical protein ACFQU7_07375 [Pseudoroseomonas wenyumeiae]